MMPAIGTVFFDLGDTLGTPVLSPPPVHLAGFDAFDFAAPVLTDLRDGLGLRLGVISNTGDDAGPAVDAILAAAGLLASFVDGLRIYSRDVGLRKDSPAIFELAAARAAAPPSECMFVGENPDECAFARAAGMTTAPSPLLATPVLAGETLHRVRLTAAAADWRAVLARLRVVPLAVSGGPPIEVEAVAPTSAIGALSVEGFAPELVAEFPTTPVTS